MSNIESHLIPGEVVLVEERQHWFVLVPWAFLIIPWLKWRKTSVAVTNKRIIATTGIFSPDTFEARLNKIASVTFDQTLFGRIFGYGNLKVKNIGGETFEYGSIKNAKQIKQIFNEALDKMENTH